MGVNTIAGCNCAYGRTITAKNIRKLWEKIVAGVCDNADHMGKRYRDGMVYIGSIGRIVHTPAAPERIPELMDNLFAFLDSDGEGALIRSFTAHFYFVYVHPFCDGNGRTGRLLVNLELMKAGYLPIDIKFTDRLSYYNAFDEYYVKHSLIVSMLWRSCSQAISTSGWICIWPCCRIN